MVASLSFHSAITGLTLGLEEEASGVWINLAAIASHKFVIAFSVGVEMVSSKVCHYIYISLQKIVVVFKNLRSFSNFDEYVFGLDHVNVKVT